MSNDIRDILERLDSVANPRQLPALFKPKSASPALDGPYAVDNVTRGYLVGEEEEEKTTTALEETMTEIEEDMLSRVKKDLTQYLDRLEKKMHIDRDLRDKAVDAIEKGQAEEEDEVNQEPVGEDPTTQDSMISPPPAPQQDPTLPESVAVKTITLEDGAVFEIHGDQDRGFEVRHQGRCLPTRFPNIDHAQMALDLFGSRRRAQNQDSDYLEER